MLSDSKVSADGKVFPRDDPSLLAPYQRALIVHDAGREFLLIQTEAVGKAEEFGWVIPVPAVPAVGSLDREKTDEIFSSLAEQTKPRVIRLSAIIFGAILILWGTAFLSALAHKKWILASLVFVVPFLVFVLYITPGSYLSSIDQAEVEILASARVGIYDVKVLRAEDPDALKDWLVGHGFQFGAEDEEIFRSYIDRSWSFVAARVAPEATTGEGRLGDLLPPMALLFDSPEPVYPWALTATVGYPVELRLYVAATSCVESPPLDMKYSGRYPWSENFGEFPGGAVSWSIGSESKPEAIRFAGADWLTELQALIYPGAVGGDLTLAPAPNRAYRPTIWR
jgi:hypothetical protein